MSRAAFRTQSVKIQRKPKPSCTSCNSPCPLASPMQPFEMIAQAEIPRKAPPPWLGPPPSRAQLDGQLPPPPLITNTPGIQLTWSTLLPPMPQRPPPRPKFQPKANAPRAKAFSGRQRSRDQLAQAWIPTLPSIPEHSQYTEPQPPPPLPPPVQPPLPPPPMY